VTRGMSRDANGVVIQQANGFVQKDSNNVVQPVPAAVDTPVIVTWPANALALAVYPMGASLYLCDPDEPTNDDFWTPLSQKSWVEVPGKPGDVTTFVAVTTLTTFYYRFEVLK